MPLNADAKNLMLAALGSNVTYFSLHTSGTPSSGNEISGGSPAYARKAATWSAATSSQLATTGTFVFDVPASTTVASCGFFGHVSNATPFYGGADLTDESFAAQGTYTLTSVTLSLSDPA